MPSDFTLEVMAKKRRAENAVPDVGEPVPNIKAESMLIGQGSCGLNFLRDPCFQFADIPDLGKCAL